MYTAEFAKTLPKVRLLPLLLALPRVMVPLNSSQPLLLLICIVPVLPLCKTMLLAKE